MSKKIRIARGWIKANVRKCEKPCLKRSTYSIKQVLDRETGVIISDDEFIAIMQKEGYRLADLKISSWNYGFMLERDLYNDYGAFVRFGQKYKKELGSKADFARDMIGDDCFPKLTSKEVILDYLSWQASSSAIEAFERLWDDFIERED